MCLLQYKLYVSLGVSVVLGEVMSEHRLPLLNEVNKLIIHYVVIIGSCDHAGMEISYEAEICTSMKTLEYNGLYGFFAHRNTYHVLKYG